MLLDTLHNTFQTECDYDSLCKKQRMIYATFDIRNALHN